LLPIVRTSAVALSLQDLTGQTLKDYQVLRRLGRGAMAEVYLAEQRSLTRQVALKVLNAQLAGDPSYVERFQHEARAAASLVHGNIVQIHEVGVHDGVHFIAQEYVAGRDLGELIRRHGRLEPALALDILRQVAAALHRAAEQGIVHRDIKPENIMFSRSGEVKVADFGLSRVIKGEGVNLTQVGVTMGTPLYMSPEQIEGRPVDSRSDIYSLGVTAYHMLSGEAPFTGDTPLSVAVKHLNTQAEPLGIRCPSVPEGLARVIDRMMAKKPADRFQTPLELLSELRELAKRAAHEGWAEGPENWSLTELLALGDGRNEATQRLAEVMKTSAMLTLPRWRARRTIALVAGAIVLGLVAAAVTQPRRLLAGAEEVPEPEPNVRAQLFRAKVRDTPEAWRAVGEYFENADVFDLNLAKQGLARYYLRLQPPNFSEALEPLNELADESDVTFKAFGLAGQVIALTALSEQDAQAGDSDQADRKRRRAGELSELITPEMNSQLDREMARQLEQARQALAAPN
jgi:serine/threonine-protein kinase